MGGGVADARALVVIVADPVAEPIGVSETHVSGSGDARADAVTGRADTERVSVPWP